MSKRNKGLIESATEVVEQVTPVLESAVESARLKLADGVERATPVVESALETARQKLADGVEQATPVVESALVTARAKLADGVEQVTPVLESAAETAREKLADGVVLLNEGRDAAVTKLTEVTSAPEPAKKSGGRVKWLLASAGVAVLGGAIFKKVRDSKGGGDNWQSTYTPPAPAPAPPVADADDSAAATPDEALADNVAEPHVDTTPDDPIEVVQIAEPDEVDSDPAGEQRP